MKVKFSEVKSRRQAQLPSVYIMQPLTTQNTKRFMQKTSKPPTMQYNTSHPAEKAKGYVMLTV